MKVKSLSRVRPSATPGTAAYQAPLSMGFSRQEYWRGNACEVTLDGGKKKYRTSLVVSRWLRVWASTAGGTNSIAGRETKIPHAQSMAKSEVTQLCQTLCDPMDCSLPGSSIQGILQARILEWVAISFSRRSSRPRD